MGGYHGAKLSRYQDLIDHQLLRGNPEAFDMLNTKYFIVADEESGTPRAMLNEGANGPAWFVEDVVFASSPREEMALLDGISTDYTAILSAADRSRLEGVTLGEGTISLVKYRPNNLVYRYSSAEGGLGIFSEVYYDKGWNVYVDGREVEYMRADWLLRAVVLPAGDHTVEWIFRAPAFDLVEGVTLAFSLVIIGGLAAVAVVGVVRRRKNKK